MNLKRLSDERLSRELSFAKASMSPDFPETVQWLESLRAEKLRRTVGKIEVR